MDKLTERINYLAKKSRETGLTDEEKAEQAELRAEYLKNFRAAFTGVLDNTYIEYPDGTKKKIEKKIEKKK